MLRGIYHRLLILGLIWIHAYFTQIHNSSHTHRKTHTYFIVIYIHFREGSIYWKLSHISHSRFVVRRKAQD